MKLSYRNWTLLIRRNTFYQNTIEKGGGKSRIVCLLAEKDMKAREGLQQNNHSTLEKVSIVDNSRKSSGWVFENTKRIDMFTLLRVDNSFHFYSASNDELLYSFDKDFSFIIITMYEI